MAGADLSVRSGARPSSIVGVCEGMTKGQTPMKPTSYRTTRVDGMSIFYREAGPQRAENLLLLHGLPSSSRMFEPLFAKLADRYHLIAPDYPGFGHSDWPDAKKFAYTFDHLAEVMNHFTEAVGILLLHSAHCKRDGETEIWMCCEHHGGAC